VPLTDDGVELSVDSPFLLAKVTVVNDDVAKNLTPVHGRRWLYKLKWYRIVLSAATHRLQKYVLYFPEPVALLAAKEERVLGRVEAQHVVDEWAKKTLSRPGGYKKTAPPKATEVCSTFYYYEADERFKIVLANLEWLGKKQLTQTLSAKSFKLLLQCAPATVRDFMLEGASDDVREAGSASEGGEFSDGCGGEIVFIRGYATDEDEDEEE
jgi:hypothetical protein